MSSDNNAKIMLLLAPPMMISQWEFEALEKEVASRIGSRNQSVGDRILAKLLQDNCDRYKVAKKRNASLSVYTGKELPKPGDIIYVRTSMSIDHGETDVVGGKACVREVKPLDNHNLGWVYVWEHPGHGYGWSSLLSDQEHLKKTFGDKWAYPDPDYG